MHCGRLLASGWQRSHPCWRQLANSGSPEDWIVTKDFADFLDALNVEGARYVIIGGIAVLSLIPYRTTRDLDILIEPTLENAGKVRNAVRRWGGFEPDFAPADFISGDVFSFGGLLRVEIHSRVPGSDWEGVWARRVCEEFLGVPTQFASLEDLILMKEAAARPAKDIPDLKRLRKLKERGKNR